MLEHSPEPWRLADGEVPFTRGPQAIANDGTPVVSTGCDDPHLCASEDNLRHIVACVNACAGIPIEDVDWTRLADRQPPKDGKYLVHAPSADEDMPLITIAWFHQDNGWSLLPKNWIEAITHWRALPQPPKDQP